MRLFCIIVDPLIINRTIKYKRDRLTWHHVQEAQLLLGDRATRNHAKDC